VGFCEGIAGDWIIEQATHSIDKLVGFKTSIEAVKSLNGE
jgi:phage protein D